MVVLTLEAGDLLRKDLTCHYACGLVLMKPTGSSFNEINTVMLI